MDMPAALRDCEHIFHGLLESTVVCDACQHPSITTQTFGYVALELETGAWLAISESSGVPSQLWGAIPAWLGDPYSVSSANGVDVRLSADNVPLVVEPLLQHFLLPEKLAGNVYQ